MTSMVRRHERADTAVRCAPDAVSYRRPQRVRSQKAATRPDVLDRLDREHEQLLRAVEGVFQASGTARHLGAQRLAARLQIHLAAERAVLDPLVRQRLDGGRHLVATLRGHERSMRAQLDRLMKLGDYAANYTDVLTCFETSLLAHVAVAHVDLHPALRDVTSPSERERLARELHARPATVPRHSAPGLLRGLAALSAPLVGALLAPVSVLRVLPLLDTGPAR